MAELTENQVRHLEAIQHVITRLAGNSFALKALAGTISAAVIAYAGSTDNSSPWVVGAGILPSVVFWLMDAQYLRLERLFRKLYDGVRQGGVHEPFDMNFTHYNSQVDPLWRIAKSWSVVWFYLILVVVLVVIAVVGYTGSTRLEGATMARRTFFSFDYRYVWKVNQIRNIPNITGVAAAGFADASIWEEAKKKSAAAIKRMIDDALENTTVTVVFVNLGTVGRKFIDYEIDQSLGRGNGLVAVQIHDVKDSDGNTGSPGAIPAQIKANGFKAYKYSDKDRLAAWVEAAAKIAGK